MPERIRADGGSSRAPERAPAAGATLTGPAQRMLVLQRTIGNAAVGRMLARKTADERDKASAALIDTHTDWGDLDEEAMGKALLAMLFTDPVGVHDAFDALGSTDRDDVALALCVAATDEELARAAADKDGREALRRVVRELLAGWSSADENAQMRRVMSIISDQVPQVDDGRGAKTIEIEIVTFDKGGAVMDFLGENAAGPVWSAFAWRSDEKRNQFGEGSRGHTAILVGDLAYSYEGSGWRVGQNVKEYMSEATKDRDATGQVLLLPLADARKIQKHLDAAANTGVYLFGGEICSDATGTALEEVLGRLSKDANPQHLKQQIAATGRVAYEKHWHKKGKGSYSRK